MDLCFIPPDAHYELSFMGDMLFTLANRLDNNIDNDIYDIYRKSLHPVIIDNGAAEKEQVSFDILIEKAKEINAQEIVVPDVIHESALTYAKHCDFLSTLSDNDLMRFNFMIVPHGKKIGAYLECADALREVFLERKAYITIGVSKFVEDYFSREMITLKLAQIYDNPIHLLGTTKNMYEIFNLRDYVRSNDSCIAILSAIHNIDFYNQTLKFFNKIRRPETTNDYFSQKLDEEQYTMAMRNINFLLDKIQK